MKKAENFILILITLFFTCIIIFVGYLSLSIVGNYFIMSDNSIETYPLENNDSYVFYSQSDSDITLFPWNYYADSVPFNELFPNEQDEQDSKLTAYDSDQEYLYSILIYYFYKTIPSHVKEAILSTDSSLYEIMDFSEIRNKLKVKTVSNLIYFFYDEIIDINGISYQLSFSFDGFDICSFQCRQINDDDIYSADNIRLGNECLSNFINYNERIYLNLLLLDLFRIHNYLENYTIKYVDANNIFLNLSEIYDADSENEYSVYSDFAIGNLSNSSYQIVETNDELLLILVDNNMVLHFDPVRRIFTGFNRME